MVDADLTKSVVPLISGDTPRFHTLPVSMPVKQPTKKQADRPGGAPGVQDEWLPTKKSERANLLSILTVCHVVGSPASRKVLAVFDCAGNVWRSGAGFASSMTKTMSKFGSSFFS
jgi:hypothetical protein